jgi:hypothetical protein
MMREILIVLQAVSATCAWACGVFMFRYWRQSRDRLFAFFGLAFWLMCASWILLAVLNPVDDSRPYVYLIRLIAFLLIIAAIVDKNRSGSTWS